MTPDPPPTVVPTIAAPASSAAVGPAGVPTSIGADRAGSVIDNALERGRLMIAPVVILGCIVTVRPLAGSALGWANVILLAISAVVVVIRLLPEGVVGLGRLIAVDIVSAVSAGLLFGFDSSSWAPALAFVVPLHAGRRFSPQVSMSITALTAVVATVTLAVRHDAGAWSWWLGALPLLMLPLGLARRGREERLRAAHELVEQTRRAAASEAKASALAERARVARDIHDVLAHSLSGVNMQLELADALFDVGQRDKGREAVRRARSMVVDGLGDARRAVQALRADTVELVPTLRAMIAGDHEKFEIDGVVPDLDTATAQAVIRIAQEALTNARRYAPGAPVRMRAVFGARSESADSAMVLEVLNGSAGGTVESQGGGLGLVGMRERAALLDGRVNAGPVTSGSAAGGWLVRLELPG